MVNRGRAIIVFAIALVVGFFAWEWYLSPRARVSRVLRGAAGAAETLEVSGFLSFFSASYSDFLHADRNALTERIEEGFTRVDRFNVTLDAIRVDAAGDEATASFDLMVVAVRGEQRFLIVGTPFKPDGFTAELRRGSDGWKIERVQKRAPDRDTQAGQIP